MNKIKNGFTLLELLVVVLIIGILAAIALPQYKLAVEKARMTEAIMLVRKIAEMHQSYYMSTGSYLGVTEIDKLDITIPGGKNKEKRIITKYFVYSPTACTNVCDGTTPYLAYAKRLSSSGDADNGFFPYHMRIYKTNPQKVTCLIDEKANKEQKKLCNKLNSTGSLD